MKRGASAEISVVGNKGLIGVALFMGGESTPSRAMVQSAGSAFRIEGQRLNDEFNRHVELLVLMLRTPSLYSRKRSRLPSATDTTRSISHCAADSCCLWTACRATN